MFNNDGDQGYAQNFDAVKTLDDGRREWGRRSEVAEPALRAALVQLEF